MKPARLIAGVVALMLAACGGSGESGDAPTATTTSPTTTQPVPATAKRPIVGIGEQGFAMFADQRFVDLGVKHVRRVVAYDAMGIESERDIVDAWLVEARRTGSEPFITFNHSRVAPDRLPSVDEFRSAFRAFRARYPDVTIYAAWNEINHPSQPTRDDPKRAAAFYNVVKAECAGCTVIAGDLLDNRVMVRYLRQYRRFVDGEPQIWGLHNYSDANYFRDDGLKAMLGIVSGEIWLTETGGLVKFGRMFPRDDQRAARAISHALKLARENERVGRIYVYNWTATRPDDNGDWGLIASDGTARPGYDVLYGALRG